MEPGYKKILKEAKERKIYLRQLCSDLFLDKIITLEIGCGHGHFLTNFAHAHPKKTCIGIDLCTKRILRSEKKLARAKLNNLHFIKAEATEFLEAMPTGILIDEIFILFPDPWPKSRHHKNRLIQENFLKLLSFKTLTSSKLHFRTDHEEYFGWATKEIAKSSYWQQNEDLTWSFEQETIFQKKMKTYQSLIAVRT